VLAACLLVSVGRANDWVHWRGPEQTGVSSELDLPERFSADPGDANGNLIWKNGFGSRSTPIVMNGRVYLIGDAGQGPTEQERVLCFDANTGKVLWEHRFNVFQTDIVSSRVGWTNLAGDAETGNVYAHGVQGLFFCFDRDGNVVWSRSLTEEYGRITGYGGRVNSPTVDGDLVILGMINASWGDQAPSSNRYVAFDKRTGVPVWWSDIGGRGTYYSVPVVAVINGQRLLITGGADGALHALKVRTGQEVWKFQVGAQPINTSPVVDGTRVYITHGEANVGSNVLGRIACVDAAKVTKGQPELVWKEDGIKASYSSPLIHEGRLYVCDEGAMLFCFDAATGKRLWRYKYGRVAKGSPVWADGKIYVAEVNSKFHILKPEENRCKELYSHFFPDPTGQGFVELNGSPAVANGRVYFTTRDEIYCIGKKEHKAEAGKVVSLPEETPSDPSAKPASLQVVPADVVLAPGQGATFKARLLDNNGRLLKEAKVVWTLPAPPTPPNAKVAPPPLKGEITESGELTVDKGLPGQQGIVLAKAEGLTGRARVRVAPTLPIRQDFERVPEGRTPGGWINCQGKFVVVQKDGSKVLKKLGDNPNPLLARAYAYIGLPTMKDYTIQADLMGTKVRGDMPDMGLVASRYTMLLDGNKQHLRLVSWEALPRVDKTIHFEWQPGVWYRLKLTAEVQGDKAVVRGKVWPRDQEEPVAWTIECEDATPNREGCPALYGYATGILADSAGTEIYYDNLAVTPNQK
jgi:outer membrane protein assembly factor BamB